MTTKLKPLLASFQDNWPEDEARAMAEFALSLFETDGRDYYQQWLVKERSAVVHNIFNDDEALIARFTAEFNKITAPVTNLYF